MAVDLESLEAAELSKRIDVLPAGRLGQSAQVYVAGDGSVCVAISCCESCENLVAILQLDAVSARELAVDLLDVTKASGTN